MGEAVWCTMLNGLILSITQHLQAIPLRSPLSPSGSSPDGEPRTFCCSSLSPEVNTSLYQLLSMFLVPKLP